MLEELQARDQLILERMYELERQNRLLREVNLNLRYKCTEQQVNKKLLFTQKG